MIELREEKVARIALELPPVEVTGDDRGDLLVVGWGGTHGAIASAVESARADGLAVSAIHLRHLNPFPLNLGEVLGSFDKVLVPELNAGQLAMLLRAKFLIDVMPRALNVAQTGRPGAVLLDVPMDVFSQQVSAEPVTVAAIPPEADWERVEFFARRYPHATAEPGTAELLINLWEGGATFTFPIFADETEEEKSSVERDEKKIKQFLQDVGVLKRLAKAYEGSMPTHFAPAAPQPAIKTKRKPTAREAKFEAACQKVREHLISMNLGDKHVNAVVSRLKEAQDHARERRRIIQRYELRFPRDPDGWCRAIGSVVVAPTKDPELIGEAVALLCRKRRIACETIAYSAIPFRHR